MASSVLLVGMVMCTQAVDHDDTTLSDLSVALQERFNNSMMCDSVSIMPGL